ncbi:unnamed protein product [Orchesella dallaii]|uniref:Gustatory receptor n=1 Tax=Orchesella dallaii TaxID=48710 RepID=A0ABP1R295_9HEXA
MASLYQRDSLENLNLTIRSSLQKILKVPIKISQLTGTFVFNLKSNAEISFSWSSWPLYFFLIKLFGCTINLIWFSQNWHVFSELFGGWGDTDMFSNLIIIVVSQLSDTFCALITLKNRVHIIDIHNRLVQFIVDIMLESQSDSSLSSGSEELIQEHLEMFEKTRKQLSIPTWIVVIISCMAYCISVVTTIRGAIFALHLEPHLVAALPIFMFSLSFWNMIRLTNYFVLAGILSYIRFGLVVWRRRCQYETVEKAKEIVVEDWKVLGILQNYKKINGLINELNVIFQWPLLAGMLTQLLSVLCFLYQLCSWLGRVNVAAIVSLAPGLIAHGLSFYNFCKAASDINEEGKQCVDALREMGSSTLLSKGLNRRIKMYHMAGAVEPPAIFGLIITYLLVLIQFEMNDTSLENRGNQVLLQNKDSSS